MDFEAKPVKRRRTPEILARLNEIKRVWQADMSAATIAAAVAFPASRNVIIGLFSRHADYLAPCTLTDRKNGDTRSPALRAKHRQNAMNRIRNIKPRPKSVALAGREGFVSLNKDVEPPSPVAEPSPLLNAKHLTLMQLDSSTCKWPHGDKDFTFCGADTTDAHPYCNYHRRLARRKERA